MLRKSKKNALVDAAEQGRLIGVEALLSTHRHLLDEPGSFGRTPLHAAVLNGHEHIVSLLLDAGAPVDAVDAAGVTPLMYAVGLGRVAIMEQLLAAGSNAVDTPSVKQVSLRDVSLKPRTPLFTAVSKGQLDAVCLLLAAGSRVIDAPDPVWKATPLALAAEKLHDAVVVLLIAAGSKALQTPDLYGRTPLSRVLLCRSYSDEQRPRAINMAQLLTVLGAQAPHIPRDARPLPYPPPSADFAATVQRRLDDAHMQLAVARSRLEQARFNNQSTLPSPLPSISTLPSPLPSTSTLPSTPPSILTPTAKSDLSEIDRLNRELATVKMELLARATRAETELAAARQLLSEQSGVEQLRRDFESLRDAIMAREQPTVAAPILRSHIEVGRALGSRVCLARWQRGPLVVAIRRLASEPLASCRKELEINSRLRHPNVVAYYGAVVDDASGQPLFLMTEYMSGGSLAGLLYAEPPAPLPGDRKIAVLACVCTALQYIHSLGVLHLAVRPATVLLDRHTGAAKLAYLAETVALLGPYAAPELPDAASAMSDMFSFGVLVAEVAERRPPSPGQATVEVEGRAIDEPVLKLLACNLIRHQPSSRWSAAEACRALAQVSSTEWTV